MLSVQGFQESPGPVGGRVWLALHGPLLFLSAGPEPWAPKLGYQRVTLRDHSSDFTVWDMGALKSVADACSRCSLQGGS